MCLLWVVASRISLRLFHDSTHSTSTGVSCNAIIQIYPVEQIVSTVFGIHSMPHIWHCNHMWCHKLINAFLKTSFWLLHVVPWLIIGTYISQEANATKVICGPCSNHCAGTKSSDFDIFDAILVVVAFFLFHKVWELFITKKYLQLIPRWLIRFAYVVLNLFCL